MIPGSLCVFPRQFPLSSLVQYCVFLAPGSGFLVPCPLGYYPRFPLCFLSPVSTKFPSSSTVFWFWCVVIVLLIPGSRSFHSQSLAKFPRLFLGWCFVPGPFDYDPRSTLSCPSPVFTKFPSSGTVCSWFWCVVPSPLAYDPRFHGSRLLLTSIGGH